MPRAAATLAMPAVSRLRSRAAAIRPATGPASVPHSTAGWSLSSVVRREVRVLPAGSEEALHRALAVRAGNPARVGAELKFSELGLGADGVDGGEQGWGIDAIERRRRLLLLQCGHGRVPVRAG